MIRQFDASPNPSVRTRAAASYVVVAPLYLPENALPLSEPSAEVEIQGQALLRHRIASLTAHEDAIRRALDRLFTGF